MSLMSNYVPDQLMTPNELDMIRKLFSFRYLKSVYPDHTVLQVSFDFSKWNNSMRKESIDVPASLVIDSWFGTNIFGRTMEAYTESLVYYKDHHVTRHWFGQDGGIEGLNQATWSMVFIAGIKQALEALGLIYQLTVKGDDVRAAIVIPRQQMTENDLIHTRDQILEQLRQLCMAMGWSLNPHECFVSLGVICTSKQYQFNETWLPADDKKMIKCESLSNLVFPTTEDLVSSIFSTAHSACSQATAIMPAFVCATILAARVLKRDIMDKSKDSAYLSALLMWPQVLGGPGSLPLQTFIVRGENDTLALSLSLLRHALRAGEGNLVTYIERILNVPLEKNPNMKQLLSDPYSIPLDIPSRPSNVLKRIMRQNLKLWVKNQDILVLLRESTEKDKEQTAQLLITMRPFFPKLACAIWECTPFVLLDEILAKFMQSSTIFAFLSKGKTGHLMRQTGLKNLKKVTSAALERNRFWHRTLSTPSVIHSDPLGVPLADWLDFDHVCTTEVVHRVREMAWGLKLEGITYPSLIDQNMVYLPADLTTDKYSAYTESITTQIHVKLDEAIYQTDDHSHHYAIIPGTTPWLGTITSRKLVFPKFDRQVRSPTLSKILRLLGLVRSGTHFGVEFTTVVKTVLKSLTCVDIDQLRILVPESGGGHVCHRVEINSFSMTTMPNYRPNISQLITINSENMKILQYDMRNRTINFAARHFFLTVLCLFTLQSHINCSPTYPSLFEVLFHADLSSPDEYKLCPWCCNVVDDVAVVFDLSLLPDLSRYVTLRLIGTSEYEQDVLARNTESAIRHKQRRLLENVFLDPNDPINQAVAWQTVVHTFATSNVNTYNLALAAKYKIIPPKDILNIVGINLGTRGINPDQLSIKLLRAVPADRLYECVLAEVFHNFLNCLAMDGDDFDIFRITYMQAHLNPLSGMFTSISVAGKLKDLAVGAKNSGYLVTPFSWPVGSATSGNASYKHFVASHLNLFKQWYTTGQVPPRVKFFLHYEDDETIGGVLKDVALSRRTLFMHKCLTYFRSPSEYASIGPIFLEDFRKIAPDALFSDENVQLAREMVAVWFDPWLNGVSYTEWPASKLGHLVVELVAISFLESIIELGDVELLEDNPGPAQTPIIHLLRLPTESDAHFPKLTANVQEQSPLWGLFIKHLDPEFAQYIWAMLYAIFEQPDYVTYAVRDRGDMCHALDSWTKTFGVVQLSLISQDGAVQLVEEFSHRVAELDIADLVEHPPSEGSQSDLLLPQHLVCQMRHREGYEEVRYQPLQFVQQVNNLIPELGRTSAHLANLEFHLDQATGLSVDIHALGRFSYAINQALAHWIETLGHFGALNFLKSLDCETPVVILGDGSGSVSNLIARSNNNIHVVYSSLQRNKGSSLSVSDSAMMNPPYEELRGNADSQISDRIHWQGMYPGDIFEPDLIHIISRRCKTYGGYCPMIISDIELQDPQKSLQWSVLVVKIFRLVNMNGNEDTSCFLKLHLSCHPALLYCLYLLRVAFTHMHIYKPTQSPSYSRHIIIYLSGFGLTSDDVTKLEAMRYPEISLLPNYTAIHSIGNLLWLPYKSLFDFIVQRVTTMPSFHNICNLYREMELPVPNLPLALTKCGLLTDIRPTHLCAFPHIIFDTITDEINTAEHFEYFNAYRHKSGTTIKHPIKPPERLGGVYSHSGHTKLAEAVSSSKERLERLIRLYFAQQYFNQSSHFLRVDDLSNFQLSIRAGLDHIRGFLERYPVMGQLELSATEGRITTPGGFLKVHEIASDVLHKCYRLVGQWIFISLLYYRYHGEDNEILLSWHRGITIEDCCNGNMARVLGNCPPANQTYANSLAWCSPDIEKVLVDVPNIPVELQNPHFLGLVNILTNPHRITKQPPRI
nr:TPA_asm: RNA-dependent RNA polymerase [Oreina cacaliae mononega-like virus]